MNNIFKELSHNLLKLRLIIVKDSNKSAYILFKQVREMNVLNIGSLTDIRHSKLVK